jgi:hypothetical protein
MTAIEARRVFDLPANASDDDIRATYRKLVQVWHPDRFSGRDHLAAFAHERLVSINEAYEVLLSRPRSRGRRSSRRSPEHQSSPHDEPPSSASSYHSREDDASPRLVLKDQHWIYVNAAGRKVIPHKFFQASPFYEGRAAVADSCDPYYFITLNGDRLPGSFERVKHFSEGLAGVCVDGKWGFIDLEGRFVVEPRYAAVHPFSEGCAAVQQANRRRLWIDLKKWGFIDRKGRQIIAPRFDEVFDGGFHRGEALVKLEDAWFVVDMDGGLRSTRTDVPSR